jgi:hypothetical protein
MSIIETVMVAWLLMFPAPLSWTNTSSENEGFTSKFIAAAFAIVSSPVEALIAKAPFVFPEGMKNVFDWPASGSEAITVPNEVPFKEFSAIEKDWLLINGASFISITETVIDARLLRVPLPLSWIFTKRVKEG